MTDVHCRAARDEKELAAREMESAKGAFIRAQGRFNNASANLASHHEMRPHYSNYPTPQELAAWESRLVEYKSDVQQSEHEYAQANSLYGIKRAEWHRICDRFQILADRESEMRSRLTPNRPKNGIEVTYGSGRTTILARG